VRSAEIFLSLNQIPNRFMLCQVISQSARLVHKNGSPIQESLSDALSGIQVGKFRGESRMPEIPHPIEPRATVLFGLPELL
jgi:hypothetical protein